jgi:hypothetical protein
MPEQDVYYNPENVGTYAGYFRDSWTDADQVLDHAHDYIRNISFSLQYLEYLNNWMRPRGRAGNIHTSVTTHLQKTFIIVAMGVIESVLWFAIKRDGSVKATHYQAFKELITNQQEIAGEQVRSRVILEKRIDPPEELEMTLREMSQKAEQKHLLGRNHDVYGKLNHLRRLRNRVHIHAVQHDRDNDWWAIKAEHFDTMKKTLHTVLTCEIFANSASKTHLIEFLIAPQVAP